MATENFLAPRRTTKDIPSMQEFQFLNVTESLQLNELDRMTVRVQCMRDYHQRKKSLNSSRKGTNVVPKRVASERQGPGCLLRFKLESKGLQPTLTQPQPTFIRGRLPHHPRVAPLSHCSVKQWTNGGVHGTKLANISIRADETDHRDLLDGHEGGDASQDRINHGSKTLGPIDAPFLGPSLVMGELSAFDPLPLRSDPRIRLRLHQLRARISSWNLMMDYRIGWFSYAMHDNAFFHVMLSHLTADSGFCQRKGDPTDAVRYRMESARIINDRLGSPQSSLSDGTVATVAVLAKYEVLNGSLVAATHHMNGLEKMVKLRGGLEDISFPSTLRRLILWTDINAACHMSCIPRFSCAPHFTSYGNIFSPSGTTFNQRSNLESTWLQTGGCLGLSDFDCEEIVLSFVALRRLSQITTSNLNITGPANGCGDNHSYSDEIYLLQRRLMSVCTASPLQTTYIDTCCCLAALIYMHVIFFEVCFDSRVVEILLDRMRWCMGQQLDDSSVSESCYAVLANRKVFWLLIMGGIAAEDTPHRNWFANLLRVVCSVLCIETFMGSREFLSSILWDSRLEPRFLSLWNEIN